MGTEGGSPSDGSLPCENVWGAPKGSAAKAGGVPGLGQRQPRRAAGGGADGYRKRNEGRRGLGRNTPGHGQADNSAWVTSWAFIAEASTSCSHPSCAEYLQTMET